VGILANKWLRHKLAPFGYYESVNTPSLWYHTSQPISFTLAVDVFGVEYGSQEDIAQLISSIIMTYKLTEEWTSNLNCASHWIGTTNDKQWTYQCWGTLKGNCRNTNTANPSNCNHVHTFLNQKNGTDAQAPLLPNESPKLDQKSERYQESPKLLVASCIMPAQWI
jgi:hypothetical protein